MVYRGERYLSFFVLRKARFPRNHSFSSVLAPYRKIIDFNVAGLFFLMAFFGHFTACNQAETEAETAEIQANDNLLAHPRGSLFIIGGGQRPPALMRQLIELAGVEKDGEILIIPWASEVPDSSAWFVSAQFYELGIDSSRVTSWIDPTAIESLQAVEDKIFAAGLIFFTGGDQNTLMQLIDERGGATIFKDAYFSGACIAGTSAGAAVMSHLMITGKDVQTDDFFQNTGFIEANRVMLAPGLGLVSNAIIDQHFTERNRLNRLISTALENPGLAGIGINESTALIVQQGRGKVAGTSQIIKITGNETKMHDDGVLLGGKNYTLDIYLPGDRLNWSFH